MAVDDVGARMRTVGAPNGPRGRANSGLAPASARSGGARDGWKAQADSGFALAFVLLGMLVALGVASAAAAAAVGQVRAAAAAGRVVESAAAARAGIESALASAQGASVAVAGDSAVTLASGVFSTGASWSVSAIRLSAETHLLVGEARVGGGVPWREGRIAWWMQPAARVARHRAVVESPGLSPGATVEADSLLAARPGVPGCGQEAAIRQAFGGGLPAQGGLPAPPDWGGDPGSDYESVRLGWLGLSRLLARADRNAPSAQPGAASWQGLVAANADVVVTGPGAGVLVVYGDLTVEPAGSWTGLALVSGSVTLRGAARLVGLLRSGGPVDLGPNAAVDGSACAALASLSNAPSLVRPIAFPGRSRAGPVSPGER